MGGWRYNALREIRKSMLSLPTLFTPGQPRRINPVQCNLLPLYQITQAQISDKTWLMDNACRTERCKKTTAELNIALFQRDEQGWKFRHGHRSIFVLRHIERVSKCRQLKLPFSLFVCELYCCFSLASFMHQQWQIYYQSARRESIRFATEVR